MCNNARRLVQLTNENLVTYRFDYDPMNHLTAEIGFDNRKTLYHYNEQGELDTQQEFGTDNHKQVLRTTAFKRDNLGRIIAEQISQADGQNQQTTYHYDPLSRLSHLADEQTTIHFTYDNVGRVIEHHLSDNDGHSQSMRYAYDANGNRLTTTLPNGAQIDYLYYGSGHLSAIKFNDRLITDITRDKLHREVERTQGKLVTSFKLDAIGRLKAQLATLEQQTTQTTPQALVKRSYRYNEVGNLIQSRDLRTGNQDYYYDKLGQLTMTGNEVFAFDPAHNLIERETDKQLNNQLHEYQGVTYRYDAFGNLSQRQRNNGELQTYSYNAKDQLIKAVIQTPNQTAQEWHYQYDVLGRRTAKVRWENGVFLAHTKTEFVWDGSHLVQEINRKNDRTYSYIYRSPQSYEPLAQVCTDNNNHAQTRYFHCDQIGVPRELTDENGNLCWYGDYLGWGRLRNSHNLTTDAHQPFRLQNQYADEETGLHYNFFRYYDPHIGRFTRLDPIGLTGGSNLYTFAPSIQQWTDVYGLSADSKILPTNWENPYTKSVAMTEIMSRAKLAPKETQTYEVSVPIPKRSIAAGAGITSELQQCTYYTVCDTVHSVGDSPKLTVGHTIANSAMQTGESEANCAATTPGIDIRKVPVSATASGCSSPDGSKSTSKGISFGSRKGNVEVSQCKTISRCSPAIKL